MRPHQSASMPRKAPGVPHTGRSAWQATYTPPWTGGIATGHQGTPGRHRVYHCVRQGIPYVLGCTAGLSLLYKGVPPRNVVATAGRGGGGLALAFFIFFSRG